MKIFPSANFPQDFSILETTNLSQHAFMTLQAGEASSHRPSVHPESDQALILLDGEMRAEIDGETAPMKRGDAVLVRAGTPHRFVNTGESAAVSYTTYSPPAYPAED